MIAYIATIIGTTIGIIVFVFGIAGAKGAPQEASVSAMALVLAIMTYIFYKLYYCEKALKNQAKIIALLDKESETKK
jgi:uncharacterized membrane protein YdjX (TVP38/TMEM64 family)